MTNEKHNLVFIVEDNDIYSLMLDYTLSNDSICRIMSFKTGEECISNLHLNPMMIILDYSLPGIDGMETFLEIKKYNLEIPVVILTANHDMKIARKFLNAGVYDFLEKEENAVAQIEHLINTVIKRCEEREFEMENTITHRRVAAGLLFFTVIIIVTIYLMAS